MKNHERHDDSHLEFWAAYWNITIGQLRSVIDKIGSRSFLKIQNYMESKLTRH